MKNTYKIFAALFLLVGVWACKKVFNPIITTTDHSFLVVEGVVNSGTDTTYIFLSRTIKLDSARHKPEEKATVVVESDQSNRYPLTEVAQGKYMAINLNLPTDRKYRLHIVTAAGKEYLSDFVENKITPPIDSITYKPLTTGVQFYANAHDATNKTRYYRWDYDETWTYQSAFTTNMYYDKGVMKFRTSDELINICYKHARPSNSVFIGSTTKLAADVVSQVPVGYVDSRSGKMFHKYSMELTQYALTPEAYTYWELLKKNTEQLGSIFDASPSSSLTNIHAVNSEADVIGYVSVSTVSRKRIFVEGRDLPFGVSVNENPGCKEDTILFEPLDTYPERAERTFGKGDSIATVVHARKPDGFRLGYVYSNKECVDCRLKGGTNVKPPYWQ